MSDPFELSASDCIINSLVQEENEYTHIQIQYKNPIALSNPPRIYRFRIIFDNTNMGWDAVLGYDYNLVI
jgi:hypothetical protein